MFKFHGHGLTVIFMFIVAGLFGLGGGFTYRASAQGTPPQLETAPPVPLPATPYAEFCFAPEWYAVKGTLASSNATEALGTTEQAHRVLCAPGRTTLLEEPQLLQRRTDTMTRLLRLKSQLPPLSADRTRVLNLRIEVLMAMLRGNDL